MTETSFYDDNMNMNHTITSKVLKDKNFITHFMTSHDINIKDRESKGVLDCALTSDDKSFIELLLNAVNYKKMDITTSLHSAIEFGKEENIRLLLDYGARTDSKDSFGKTPLHLSVSMCCQDKRKIFRISKLLLEKSTDPKSLLNECTDSGDTPLHYSIINGSKDLINLFILHGANVNAKNRDGKTPLYIAIENKNIEIVRLLLKNRAKVNEKMIYGLTALHEAVKQHADKSVKLLLSYGAKVNAKDIHGQTPLHLAVRLNYLDEKIMNKIVKLLLDEGADVNSCTNLGETAFHYAIADGNEKLVRLFLDYGANVNSKGFDGKSPLYFAIQFSNKNIVKLLLDQGAKIDDKTNDGKLPLHVAVAIEDENMVRILLDYNADVNAIDKSGKTPLSLAFEVAHMRSIYNPWNGFCPINSQVGCDANIFELLIKHIALLKYVSEENIRVISSNEKLNSFYKRCQRELNNMKENKICDNICLHKVLTKDIHAVVGYARNENLSNAFESGLCARQYPIYYRYLKDKFYKAERRRKLLEPSSAVFIHLVKPIVLPELVINKILTYLEEEDLMHLRMV